MSMTTGFSSETIQAGRQWSNLFLILKEKARYFFKISFRILVNLGI